MAAQTPTQTYNPEITPGGEVDSSYYSGVALFPARETGGEKSKSILLAFDYHEHPSLADHATRQELADSLSNELGISVDPNAPVEPEALVEDKVRSAGPNDEETETLITWGWIGLELKGKTLLTFDEVTSIDEIFGKYTDNKNVLLVKNYSDQEHPHDTAYREIFGEDSGPEEPETVTKPEHQLEKKGKVGLVALKLAISKLSLY